MGEQEVTNDEISGAHPGYDGNGHRQGVRVIRRVVVLVQEDDTRNAQTGIAADASGLYAAGGVYDDLERDAADEATDRFPEP